MRCASCGAGTSAGAEYIVRYGSLAGSTYRHKTVTKIYGIAGKEDVFLCDSCVDRRVNRLAALYGGGLAGLSRFEVKNQEIGRRSMVFWQRSAPQGLT